MCERRWRQLLQSAGWAHEEIELRLAWREGTHATGIGELERHRAAALSERDTALTERDKALSLLQDWKHACVVSQKRELEAQLALATVEARLCERTDAQSALCEYRSPTALVPKPRRQPLREKSINL